MLKTIASAVIRSIGAGFAFMWSHRTITKLKTKLKLARLSNEETKRAKKAAVEKDKRVIKLHDDPDLAEVDEKRKFFLKFPNDKEIVDIDRIISFLAIIAKRYSKPDQLSRYMREYALHRMDWGVKMKKYVEFCSQV